MRDLWMKDPYSVPKRIRDAIETEIKEKMLRKWVNDRYSVPPTVRKQIEKTLLPYATKK